MTQWLRYPKAYAWQAGVRRSLVSFIDQTGCPLASGRRLYETSHRALKDHSVMVLQQPAAKGLSAEGRIILLILSNYFLLNKNPFLSDQPG